jgi:hypothetical protein
MSWSAPRVIGTALQMFGLGLAAYGVAETRESYAPERLGVVGTTRTWLLRLWIWTSRLVRTRLLRRPPRPKVVALGIADELSLADSIGVEISYGMLDQTRAVDEHIAILDQRSRALRDDLNRLRRETRAAQRDLERWRGEVDAARADLRDEMRRDLRQLVTEGLSREAIGLTLTAVGTLLAAFG